jgi:phosphohistidine phosphatase
MVIYLLRHGKAEARAPSRRDEDRALTSRGRDQATHIGALLARRSGPLRPPRTILSSPAVRAAQTARIVAQSLALPVKFEARLGLDAASSALEELLGSPELRDAPAPVLLVGHNPRLEDLALALTADGRSPVHHLRTGELVALECPVGEMPARLLGVFRLDGDD